MKFIFTREKLTKTVNIKTIYKRKGKEKTTEKDKNGQNEIKGRGTAKMCSTAQTKT